VITDWAEDFGLPSKTVKGANALLRPCTIQKAGARLVEKPGKSGGHVVKGSPDATESGAQGHASVISDRIHLPAGGRWLHGTLETPGFQRQDQGVRTPAAQGRGQARPVIVAETTTTIFESDRENN